MRHYLRQAIVSCRVRVRLGRRRNSSSSPLSLLCGFQMEVVRWERIVISFIFYVSIICSLIIILMFPTRIIITIYLGTYTYLLVAARVSRNPSLVSQSQSGTENKTCVKYAQYTLLSGIMIT